MANLKYSICLYEAISDGRYYFKFWWSDIDGFKLYFSCSWLKLFIGLCCCSHAHRYFSWSEKWMGCWTLYGRTRYHSSNDEYRWVHLHSRESSLDRSGAVIGLLAHHGAVKLFSSSRNMWHIKDRENEASKRSQGPIMSRWNDIACSNILSIWSLLMKLS